MSDRLFKKENLTDSAAQNKKNENKTMLSLHNYFENDILILQETLVDKVFKSIDSNLIKDKVDLESFFDFIESIEKQFNLKLDKIQRSKKLISVEGKYYPPNRIELIIPYHYYENDGTMEKIHVLEMIYVFLHEFSHFITDKLIPNQIKIDKKLIPPPNFNILFNSDNESVKKFLDYIFQLYERPNFAFSIGLSILNNRTNLTKIKNEYKNKPDNYILNLSDPMLALYFQIIKFVDKLKDSKYLRKKIELDKLIEKYYRRFTLYFGTDPFELLYSNKVRN